MSRTRFLIVLVFASLLAAALVAAGCGGDDDDEVAGGDLGLIKEGELLAGIDTPFPPFEKGHPPNITGYDIDVINAIADELGLEVIQQETSFETIFRDVAQGKFDVAVAASTITPERERTVDFSDPYYLADQSLLVAEGSDIGSQEDLGGKIVGAQDGTTGETYANDETDASEVRGFPGGTDAINALRAGQIDAVIVDSPVAEDAVAAQGGIEIAEKIVTRELYGFSFTPDNDALREAVNEALATLKEDGTIEELYGKYFPDDDPQKVLDATHEPT